MPPSRASTRASSWPTRGRRGTAGGPAGRGRRGVRLHLRSRPHRVPGRAEPPGRPRGDGDHDPGGGRDRAWGTYFLPAFSGVAFSNNEFRWSPRIKREDGLVRLVPGLGTRAVDRLSDDYPVLLAPGQPGLRVNTTADEIVRYSPKKMDLINLETGSFETVRRRGPPAGVRERPPADPEDRLHGGARRDPATRRVLEASTSARTTPWSPSRAWLSETPFCPRWRPC